MAKKLTEFHLSSNSFQNRTNGFRVGGPIIKNKLFFFGNVEFADGTQPALNYSATGNPGIQAATTAADLNSLSAFMKQYLNYDLGQIDNYNKPSKSKIYLGRIDWNINDHNKLSVRYDHHDSSSYQVISNSNSSATAGYGNRNNLLTAISGQNTGYNIQDNTRSIAVELNSSISSKLSNQFLATYNKQIEDRTYLTPGIFPTIDILNGSGINQTNGTATYTSVGMDPFTPNNKLNYSTLNLTDNVKVSLGTHTITAGVSYEKFISNNLFFYASNGVWTYNDIQDFRNAVLSSLGKPLEGGATSAPQARRFNYAYTLLPDGQLPYQTFKINTSSAYIQDAFKATDNFRLYYGARLDYVDIPNTAAQYTNTNVLGMTFYKEDGTPFNINTGSLPKAHLYISPRFGFNWDVKNNKTTQVRGGTGVFLSRLPYVLISNQLGNNGVNIGRVSANNTTAYPFTLDPSVYTPKSTATATGFNINYTDPNLKMPQVWKTSLGVDQKLNALGGLVATVEGIYTKNINALYYYDANFKPSTSNFTGQDPRAIYTLATRYNPTIGAAYVLANTNKGYYYSLTAKLEKPISNNWGGLVGYTYSKAYDLASVGSTVNVNIPSTIGINNLTDGYGDNDLRHNIVGTLSYKFNYGSGLFGGATTISLGMFARSGYKFSYVTSGDINTDGQNGNDLIYVPVSASQLKFVPLTVGSGLTAVTYSAADQAAAFDSFVNGNKYLSDRKGQYAQRNGAAVPWLTRYDLSIAQDLIARTAINAKANQFQIRFDILNVGNLINNKWGVSQSVVNSAPLVYKGKDVSGAPTYTIATQVDQATGKTILLRDSFQRNASINDVFQVQIGLRYTFNK
ncbi:TonB-dependent receptor [Halpernia sp. GG3]